MTANNWPTKEPTNEELSGRGTKPKKTLVIVITAAIAAIAVIAATVFGVANWKRDIKADGVGYQARIMELRRNVITGLSNCLDKTMIAANIAQSERESLKETLASALSARAGSKADPTTTGGQAFVLSVVREAYPEISDELFRTLMATALGCRDDVTDAQEQLGNHITEFRQWRADSDVITGSVRETFPNEELYVVTLDGRLTGKLAEEFMFEPITTKAADDASKTNRMPEQQPLPGATPR